MLFFKIYWHASAILWKLIYKFLYSGKLKMGGELRFVEVLLC